MARKPWLATDLERTGTLIPNQLALQVGG